MKNLKIFRCFTIFKIPILSLLLIILFSGFAGAQIIDCDAIGKSPLDSLRVVSKWVRAGDTVMVALSLMNETGVATFQIYLEYDSTFMKPIITAVDSLRDEFGNFLGQTQNLYDYAVHGRLLYTEQKFDSLGFPYLDTTTNVLAVDEIDFPGSGNLHRIKIIGAFEDLFTPEEIIAPGADTIMYIKFVIDDSRIQDEVSTIGFYDETIETRDTVFPYDIVRTDCLYSRFGDVTGIIDIRLTPIAGVVQIKNDLCDKPVINSFTASPTSINTGQSIQLSWDVTDATSISIDNGVGTSTNSIGTLSISPTATTIYSLTAFNSCGQVVASASVTVGTIIVPGNNNPVVNSVSGSPFTVNQGESVSFSVTATDVDASDIITLSSVSLPGGGNFNSAVGTGSVSGNFSWTPDFSTTAGVYAATFRATDNNGGVSNTVTVIINVIEIQNDKLFTTSKIGQQPVGGLKGKKAIYLPINLVTSQTVYGVQFDFYYDQLFFEVDSFVVTGRTADFVIYDNIGQTPGEIRIVSFGLNNEPIVTVQDTTAILYAVISIDSSAPSGDYPIYFTNGWESINPDPNVPSLELVVDSGIIQVDYPGDVNLDKEINVADLVSVVASIINNFTLTGRQFDVADVITNNIVDVFDLVGIVNMIFGVPFNSAPPSFESELATVSMAYNDLQPGGNDMLVINSEIPVDIVAVELEIEYDPGTVKLGRPTLAADADKLTINYSDNNSGKLKVLMHFTNPFMSTQIISSGFASLLNIPLIARGEVIAGNKEQLRITKALFSTSTAERVVVDGIDVPVSLPDNFVLNQNYPNPFNPTTTIDFTLNVSTEISLDIYNILGQQVRNLVSEYLPAGAHSIEWDATDNEGRSVATGIYLYRLQIDRQTQSKKMLFLK